MKKKLLLKLLPVVLLGLTACNNGGNNSGASGSGFDPSDLPVTKDVTVYFYLDYNHADENNPYFKADWYAGVPLDRTQMVDASGQTLVDPTDSQASYEEFGHFLGWSIHPVIDSLDQLWNFSTDVKVKDDRGYVLQLFGIWVEAA